MGFVVCVMSYTCTLEELFSGLSLGFFGLMIEFVFSFCLCFLCVTFFTSLLFATFVPCLFVFLFSESCFIALRNVI